MRRVRGTWLLAATVVAAGGASVGCTRVNPAFLGTDGGLGRDGGAAHDAGAVDGGLADGVGPAPDGGCQSGAPCTKAEQPCMGGTTVCTNDGPRCDGATAAPDGSSCGLDKVCKAGACIACAAGAACANPDDPCQEGVLDCSTGVPTCTSYHRAPNGTACSTGICYAGTCTAPNCGGLDNTLCAVGMACDRTGCGSPPPQGVCVTRPDSCTTTYAPVCGCDGKTYLNDCERLRVSVALNHPGACSTAVENCYNGFDDNGNGLIDCEDPECQPTSVCAAPPPIGWSGIGWVDPGALPTCPSGLTEIDLYQANTVSAGQVTCSCECGTAAGHCAADLSCFAGSDACSGTASTTTLTGCGPVALTTGTTSCKASTPRITGGCPATTKKNRPTPVWAASGRACVRASGGFCPGGTQQCVPRAPSGAEGPCIVRAGDNTCPSATPYTVKLLYYAGQLTDGRDCSACQPCTLTATCACDPQAIDCGVGIYADTICQASGPSIVKFGDICLPLYNVSSPNFAAQPLGLAVPSDATCTPHSSSVIGQIDLGPTLTVCCMP